jgi:hypothetical protein
MNLSLMPIVNPDLPGKTVPPNNPRRAGLFPAGLLAFAVNAAV